VRCRCCHEATIIVIITRTERAHNTEARRLVNLDSFSEIWYSCVFGSYSPANLRNNVSPDHIVTTHTKPDVVNMELRNPPDDDDDVDDDDYDDDDDGYDKEEDDEDDDDDEVISNWPTSPLCKQNVCEVT
jgi:hypothetical protein